MGDHPVQLGDLFVPGDVVQEGARRGAQLRGGTRPLEQLRLKAQLRHLDLLRVGGQGHGEIEGGDRRVDAADRIEEEATSVQHLRVVRPLRQSTVIERDEGRGPFLGKGPADVLFHFLFVEGRAAFEAVRGKGGRHASAERTLVLVLGDGFLRPLRRSIVEQMKRGDHLAGGDRTDFGDPGQLVFLRAGDFPRSVIAPIDQRLRPRGVEPEDFQQVHDRVAVDVPLDPTDRPRGRTRNVGWRIDGRRSETRQPGRRRELRVALIADQLPRIHLAAVRAAGHPLEGPGVAQDGDRAAGVAQDHREDLAPAGTARREIIHADAHREQPPRGSRPSHGRGRSVL